MQLIHHLGETDMKGTMQTRFECAPSAWRDVVSTLINQGFIVETKSVQDTETPLFDIKQLGSVRRGLWFEVVNEESARAKSLAIVDLHWLSCTSDVDPEWMLKLAVQIEGDFEMKGATCIFGSTKAL